MNSQEVAEMLLDHEKRISRMEIYWKVAIGELTVIMGLIVLVLSFVIKP